MMALKIDKVEQDLRGAIDYLLGLGETQGDRAGTVGFCMGGQLSLYAACANPRVGACVIYYGIHPNVHPDLKSLRAPVLGFFAEKDGFVTPEVVGKLESDLRAAGKQVEFHIYKGRRARLLQRHAARLQQGLRKGNVGAGAHLLPAAPMTRAASSPRPGCAARAARHRATGRSSCPDVLGGRLPESRMPCEARGWRRFLGRSRTRASRGLPVSDAPIKPLSKAVPTP